VLTFLVAGGCLKCTKWVFIVVCTILIIFGKDRLKKRREHFNTTEVVKMARKKFKVLIVDDEPASVEMLRSLLSEIPDVEVVGEANHSEKAFYLILEHLPHLIFLDVNMPGQSGAELKKLLNKSLVDIPVVFVSGNKEYAVDAIRNGVYDFLLKPVLKEDLQQVVEKYQRLNYRFFPGRIFEMVNKLPEESKIRINSQHSYILVNPCEIVYCQSLDGSTIIYLDNGKKAVANSNLTQLEEMVKKCNFYRLGRSLLINLDYLRRIDKVKSKCYMKAGEKSWEISSPTQATKELLNSIYLYV
jgi:two-component system LytT family response regulator